MIASDTQRKPVEVDSSQPNRKRREKGHLSTVQELATVMGQVRSLSSSEENTEDSQPCSRAWERED